MPVIYNISLNKMKNKVHLIAIIFLTIFSCKENKKEAVIESVYKKCKSEEGFEDHKVTNHVKAFYEQFTPEEISKKIAELISDASVNAEVEVIFQTVENLHKACPKNLGDWYFTGEYPTPGGNRVSNKAFINFYEGNKERAY